MLQDNKRLFGEKKVINIKIKRKSNFMIFDSLAEEEAWMKRVEEECIVECIKKEEK